MSAMNRIALTTVLLLLLPACSNPAGRGRLSYASVQALNPGVSVDWVMAEYPQGRVTRRADGVVERISYPVRDPQGKAQTLDLLFDASGRLTQKRYSGRAVRPGGAQGGPVTGTTP